MSHHVQHDGDGQNQYIVLVGSNLHSVGIADAKPALGDFGNDVIVSVNLVFVIYDVAPDMQIGLAGAFNGPMTAWG